MILPCERGFTLIELLVVIAVAAVMIGFVAPSLGHLLPRGELAAAVAELRASLRGAGATALTEGRTVTLRSDPAATGYWIDRQFHPLAAVRVAVAGAGRIAFYPWGGSSGGRVWIDGRDGRREIDIDAATGHAVVRP